MNDFSWNPFVLLKRFFTSNEPKKIDEEKVKSCLRPFLGLNPPHCTYQDIKKSVVRRLYREIGENAPSIGDVKINICGTYSRIRGIRVMWKDHEYEVGKFEMERKG